MIEVKNWVAEGKYNEVVAERDKFRKLALKLLEELKVWDETINNNFNGPCPDEDLIREAENILEKHK